MKGDESRVNRLRRTLLKGGAVGGIFALLSLRYLLDDERTPTVPTDAPVAVEGLLPADRAVSPDPEAITEPVDGRFGEPTVGIEQVSANEDGTIELDLGGNLDGAGKFGLLGAPYVESTWTAPERGEYVLTANYDVRGHAQQEAEAVLEQGGAAVATFLESTLAILDSDDRVVSHRTTVDHRTANEDHLPELVEEAVSWAVTVALGPSTGLLGRMIGRAAISGLVDWVFDTGGRADKSIAEDGQLDVKFLAEEGRTYRFRFATDGGYSGKSIRDRSGFRAALSVTNRLTEFAVEPTETEVDRAEHLLTVRKEDTDEGFGAYMLSATGDIWQENESEALIEGSTALDFVGPSRGEDTLRFAGDVENFMLKGPANVYLDGEPVDPDRLGSAEALTNTLTVESAGTQTGFFAVTVSGTIVHEERGLAEAYIRGSSALDWVGEKRGTDRFRFSGEIIEFVLMGEANVSVNGEQVDPDALGV